MTIEHTTNGHTPTTMSSTPDSGGAETIRRAAQEQGLRDDLVAAEQRAEAAEHELAQFKDRVRTRALEAKANQNWCDAGFNEAMHDLGLPELVRSWTGTATVHVRVTDTSSEDVADAVRWVHNALGSTDVDVEVIDIETVSLIPERD